MDSAKEPVGVAPTRPLITDVAESALRALSHFTLPSSSRIPALSPVAIRVPVLSKNCTKASEITATRKSMLSRSDDMPSRNAPTGGMAGIDTRSSGTGIVPTASPRIAVTTIPMKTAPGNLLA